MNLLLGNEHVNQVFSSIVREDRLHHCYLFEGPVGVGKSTFAINLVKRNCCMSKDINANGLQSCQNCWSCRMIDEGNHPDVMQIGIDPERTAPIISVRQAREIIGRVDAPPFRAKHRFVIIDPADAMRDEAANALLKTFEEPPPHTKFILITQSAHRLLPTIRSRSQRVRFKPCSEEVLTNWLIEQGCDDAQLVSRLSYGCPGKAIRLMDGEIDSWIDTRRDIFEVLNGLAEERFQFTAALTRGKREIWVPEVLLILDILQSLSRDALCLHSGRERELINIDCIREIESWSGRVGNEKVYELYGRVEKVRSDLELYVNARLLLDALLTDFSSCWRKNVH